MFYGPEETIFMSVGEEIFLRMYWIILKIGKLYASKDTFYRVKKTGHKEGVVTYKIYIQ